MMWVLRTFNALVDSYVDSWCKIKFILCTKLKKNVDILNKIVTSILLFIFTIKLHVTQVTNETNIQTLERNVIGTLYYYK